MKRQRTLRGTAQVQGFGYWSGRDITLRFEPAPCDTGLLFIRDDLPGLPRIPAAVAERVEVPRRTCLAAGGATVEMVEHVLAALRGLGITNCFIHANGAEMPGCDGSALPFVTALMAAGTLEQPAPRPRLVVTEIVRVGNDESWVEARPVRDGSLTLEYKLDYGPNTPIGRQTYELRLNEKNFQSELAPARTFILESEAAWLRERGLGMRVTPQDLLIYSPDGVLENELRFPNECVRHKTLDLVGDLALAGCDIVGQIIACRSGHRLNAELVKVLLSEGRKEHFHRRVA